MGFRTCCFLVAVISAENFDKNIRNARIIYPGISVGENYASAFHNPWRLQ